MKLKLKIIHGVFSGIEKEIGRLAVRARPPEPYNGKGVLYKDEIIIRKTGKEINNIKIKNLF